MKNKSNAAPVAEIVDPAVELLAQADSRTARFEVSEVNPGTGRPDYIEPVDIEAVKALGLHEFLRQRYCLSGHGGTFQVRIRKRSGTYGPSVSVPIAGDSNVPRDRAGTPVSTAIAAPVAATANPWLDRLIVPATLAIVTALAGALAKKLMESEKPGGVSEALKLVELVNKANGGAKGGSDPEAVFGLVEKVMAMQTSIIERANVDGGSRRERGGGMISLVENVGGRVVSLLERKMENDERRRVQRGAVRGQARVTEASGVTSDARATGTTSSSARVEPNDPLVEMLENVPVPARMYLHHLAKSGSDPADAAERVLDEFDDETYNAIADELDRPDFVDVLIRVVPAFAPEREWFAQLVVAMRASVRLASAAEGVPSRDTAEHVDNPAGSGGNAEPSKASA